MLSHLAKFRPATQVQRHWHRQRLPRCSDSTAAQRRSILSHQAAGCSDDQRLYNHPQWFTIFMGAINHQLIWVVTFTLMQLLIPILIDYSGCRNSSWFVVASDNSFQVVWRSSWPTWATWGPYNYDLLWLWSSNSSLELPQGSANQAWLAGKSTMYLYSIVAFPS